MKLYVCYGTFPSPRPGGHPCKNALEALKEAGYDPEVERTYGAGVLPTDLNKATGRAEVIEKAGQKWVPALELDDGKMIYPSKKIIAWAKENPATAKRPARTAAG
jgi:hypothetical protein